MLRFLQRRLGDMLRTTLPQRTHNDERIVMYLIAKLYIEIG